jgi:hypothetical protein
MAFMYSEKPRGKNHGICSKNDPNKKTATQNFHQKLQQIAYLTEAQSFSLSEKQC